MLIAFPSFARASAVLVLMLLCWGNVQAAHIVFVKVLVDEEEVSTEPVWKQRLTDRIHQASELIAQYCEVRFVVRYYAYWQSDNRLQDFARSLTEFTQEVDPGKSRLAIGFSSQYRFKRGRNHLGGTRGPLQKHILIRENAPTVLDPERVEVLVHELGSQHLSTVGHAAGSRGRTGSSAFVSNWL